MAFNKFLYTLDPIPLENLPEHMKKKLHKISRDNLDSSWGRILDNHFSDFPREEIARFVELSKKNPLFISGPITLTKHESKEYEKTIYIFGDRHGRDNACNEKDEPFTIFQFFLIYTKYIDKFIDLYIEADYIKTEGGDKISREDIYNTDSFISDVKIFLPDQPNLRIHRTDLRTYLNIVRSDVFSRMVYGFIKKFTQKDFKQFLEDFKDITFQEMLISEPVKKQLKKIADKTLKKKLLQFMKKEIQKFHCDDPEFFGLIREGIQKSIEEKKSIEEVFKSYEFRKIYLGEFTACIDFIMDIYLLARLFKTFEVESGEDHPTEAKNVFIYAGNDHAEIYRDFLGSIGFSYENIATQENTRCIRVFEPIVF